MLNPIVKDIGLSRAIHHSSLEIHPQHHHSEFVSYFLLSFFILIAASMAIDGLSRPRHRRGLRIGAGFWLLTAMMTALFGALIALTGHAALSLMLALAVHSFLVIASNAKFKMLGEPLLFSDLALVGAVFRHPQFYLSAVQMWQKVAIAAVGGALAVTLYHFYSPKSSDHLIGIGVLALGFALLFLYLRSPRITATAQTPQVQDDVARLGLLPSLMLYWIRWRAMDHPAPWKDQPRGENGDAPTLIIAVQCESFADPAEIFRHLQPQAAFHLPGLAQARRDAYQWGNLHVSGFGAYTMRTEYGVLFGRTEAELSFRRFDPLLTAMGEGSYAIPQKLNARSGASWTSEFLHPHDMRFYGRDAIMPAAGFDALIGEEHFRAPLPGEGRYVTDAAMADEILARAESMHGPAFLYAVTIENHGPWSSPSSGDLVDSYVKLVHHSDAMLSRLQTGIQALAAKRGQPAALLFFGDHRPSIPGATAPHGDRHTPYILLRFDRLGQIIKGSTQGEDQTPASLHHSLLDIILGPPLPRS